MKDYKLLLAGLILLLLIIFIAIFTWLWTSNRKNMDPLPIMASDNEPSTIAAEDEESDISNATLYLQAEESLQVPLDDVIVSFESRYPDVQVLANYVPSSAILELSSGRSNDHESASINTGTGMIIANDSLSSERLKPLQAQLKVAQDQANQKARDTQTSSVDDSTVQNSTAADKDSTSDDNSATEMDRKEARTLNSFNYALKDEQTLDGVILTDNTVAINFRNFLLSSAGQDILKKYDYYNIDGYKNSMDDLFSPTSRAKKASGDSSVDVADALSNSESP